MLMIRLSRMGARKQPQYRIVVIENGTIADIGAHEELMQKLGTYRRFYDLQFANMEVPKAVAGS